MLYCLFSQEQLLSISDLTKANNFFQGILDKKVKVSNIKSLKLFVGLRRWFHGIKRKPHAFVEKELEEQGFWHAI